MKTNKSKLEDNTKKDGIIYKTFMKSVESKIELAKEEIKNDPELQDMADEVDKLTSNLGKELRKDENFVKYLLGIVDEISADKSTEESADLTEPDDTIPIPKYIPKYIPKNKIEIKYFKQSIWKKHRGLIVLGCLIFILMIIGLF